VGTRNSSLAQAPRSVCLQRFEQKGRNGLLGTYTLGPPQAGQLTVLGSKAGEWLSWVMAVKAGGSGAQGHFKFGVLITAQLQFAIGSAALQTH